MALPLGYNGLTGCILATIADSENLVILELLVSYNEIDGTLPTELYNLSFLRTLVLTKNKLSCCLHEAVSSLQKRVRTVHAVLMLAIEEKMVGERLQIKDENIVTERHSRCSCTIDDLLALRGLQQEHQERRTEWTENVCGGHLLRSRCSTKGRLTEAKH